MIAEPQLITVINKNIDCNKNNDILFLTLRIVINNNYIVLERKK